MANSLHVAGGGLSLQVTVPARSAGLVVENAEGDATYRADTLAYAVDEGVVVVDRDTDRVPMNDRVKLLTLAMEATGSVHQGINTSLQHSGNGYSVQVPARDAGFEKGDALPCHAAPGVLVMTPLESDVPTTQMVDLRRRQATPRE